MNITVEKSDLLPLLNLARAVAEKKSTLPILGHLRVETGDRAVNIYATDLESGLSQQCAADIAEDGACTLDAKKAYDIVRELPDGPISLKTKEGDVRIVAGKSKFRLPSFDEKEFPIAIFDLPKGDKQSIHFTIPVSELLHAIRKVECCVAMQHSQHGRIGVEWVIGKSGLQLVAMDGIRMAICDCPGATVEGVSPCAFLVPKQGMMEIVEVVKRDFKGEVNGSVNIKVTDALMSVATDFSELIIRLAENDFPPYESVIPHDPAVIKFEVSQGTLNASLKRLAPLTVLYRRTIKCQVVGAALLLTYDAIEGSGSEEVAVTMTAIPPTPFVTGFNLTYWLDALRTIDEESLVEFKFVDPLRPMRILDRDDPDYSCYIGQVKTV